MVRTIVYYHFLTTAVPFKKYLIKHTIFSYFSGFKNHDVAFFHAPSKTLVQADLMMNLPPLEQVRLYTFTVVFLVTMSHTHLTCVVFQVQIEWAYPHYR